MSGIIDYVKNELSTFADKPFSDLDGVCLSQMSYLFYDGLVEGFGGKTAGIRIRDLYRAEYFSHMFRDVANTENDRAMFSAMAASPRFRDIRLLFYVNDLDCETQKQFSAITFKVSPRLHYVSFRGTDLSITGWKEDLNLACKTPVPAQAEAVNYLERAAALIRGDIIVGGHSKGGNLAVYSAIGCDKALLPRIIKVYSQDGPGFGANFIKSERYKAVRPKIVKLIPQGSVVGMMLEKDNNLTVIESTGSGFMQHSPFTWSVNSDSLVEKGRLSKQATYVNNATNSWIDSLSEEKKEEYVEALFTFMKTSGMTPLDFSSINFEKVSTLVSKLKMLSPDAKDSLKDLFATLTSASIKSLKTKKKNG